MSGPIASEVLPAPSEGGAYVSSPETTLLTELALGLATYGAPAHRLEEAVSALAEILGVRARFFAMPTAVFAMFERADGSHDTRLLPVPSSEINLERLVALDRVLNEVAEGKATANEGIQRIRDIETAPARFTMATVVVSFAVVSGAAARFFGGGWSEMGGAAIVGLVIGALAIVSGRRRDLARILEFSSGLAAALLAWACAAWVPGTTSADIVTLSGVIVLLPGLTLTMAVTELSTRNLVSGTARLMGALTVLVSIGIGVALGRKVLELSGAEVTVEPVEALGEWTLWAALLVIPAPLVVLFKARWKDLGIIAVAAVIAFVGARSGTLVLGPELGVGLGAFLVAVLGNVYARMRNRPAVVAAVPGILLLVPGAIGMRSVTAFTTQDAVAGIGLAFTTLMVAVALVAGLLLANVAVPPRKAL